jgi:alkylation response protein AidB-like acyl-CoA dehydrogenase
VPAGNLLGEEGSGFKLIMTNFNSERLAMSAMALGFAQACYDEALDWARQRKTFGAPLVRAPGHPPQAGGHADAHPRPPRPGWMR